mmetsp:Transcript_128986/g.373204  ORF Transcript_128986/g.373204 Transcript_128986/m.373204 type:complete len:213 (+) Transcript_128986:1484-2122(+)
MNSDEEMVSEQFKSNPANAAVKLPYLLMSRSLTSSRSKLGDTAASAAASCSTVTCCLWAPCGSHNTWKIDECSSSCVMPSRVSAWPNSCKLRTFLPRSYSISLTAWRIEAYPSAMSLRRRSSMVRTGAVASIAWWNSATETVPLLSVSRKSKTCEWSSLDKPLKFLFRKREKSFRVNSRSMPPDMVEANDSNAPPIVANRSSNCVRNWRIAL